MTRLQNPWGLTESEVLTMDVMTQTGSAQLSAPIRGVAYRTIRKQFDAATEKMEAPNHTMALLIWDRMRRAG